MLFKTHHISFTEVDPLDDGLREEISLEKLEPEAITLEEGIDEDSLNAYWQNVEADIKQDSEWVSIDE